MYTLLLLLAIFSAIIPSKSLNFLPQGQENLTLQINLSNGVIQGREIQTRSFGSFFAYQGIPYAAAPIGNLRFQPPQDMLDWNGILDATKDEKFCIQPNGNEDASEDCLFLNVYTKKKDNSKLLPVMVWIYGGAFISGSSNYNTYGPEYLLQKDVVVVTFNYRLGIFGFLSTQDLSCPGNYGLKDQIAALQWVQANIHLFGGDNDNVTIFGESAGAASVSYLMLAPQAKGLFHKAISESGSALCPWAVQQNAREISFQVGIVLGIFTLSAEDLVNRLRQVDVETLLRIASSAAILKLISPLNGLAYSPTIEPQHTDAVLTEGSHELFRTGRFNRVPYIIGFNSEESSVMQEMVDYLRPYLISYDLVPSNLVPDDMNIRKLSTTYVQIGTKIRLQYFGILPATIARRESILQFVSDTQFVKPILETVKLMSEFIDVYLYQFSYEGSAGIKGVNFDKPIKGDRRIVEGVGHSEEVWYLWKRQNISLANNYYDVQKSDAFTRLWTNFAKFGNPTPIVDPLLNNLIWPTSMLKNKYTYLDIGNELTLANNPKPEAMEFWEKLYMEYGNPPYDTY